ncbi:uncharacterized protein LACBIDRAFT_323111 [Laccaria bicolor S238N-H82]|uniref:Predicted protein n=1 Tax=Laccaria bicolor (strain S238N-H82 / ATCC MYA-4686) TaxID=486041 RepID=B0CZ58_LACBS|nr:uncharacterized protein LACBIDRAFT_323111 [Laccaria bicolor S238N-H82]EDR12564.1 predicted protein [Laccaria bicolor S238N-H82]|eukprot:XP_001876828.1 predicted protein [Laccaria bicolor S238N-H82]
MDEHTPSPYSPKSVSLYGRPDGTYYTKEKRYPEAENSDDEFGTKSMLYLQPVVYKYPDAHPKLKAFPHAEPAHVSKQAERDHDMATGAWVESCNARGVRVEFDEDMLKLITARASQVRGQLKTITQPLVEAASRLHMESIQVLPSDTKAHKGLYCHPVFQAIVNKKWFRNKTNNGVIHPEFSEDDTLLKITMALVITVVHRSYFHQTSKHVDVQFTTTVYKHKFNAHLKQIIKFEKKTQESKIIPCLLKHILKLAKKHAKVVDAPDTVALQLTEDDIEAAKKEWENMVFSDDE